MKFVHGLMDQKHAISALGALAQETRLELFRLLVTCGPQGLPAGVIAERLGVMPSSLSFHLQQLVHAGLITQRRSSRQLIYSAEYGTMSELMAYLTENCCGRGAPASRSAIPPIHSPKERMMKRFHVHVSVDDLAQSVRFYSTLFAAEPTVLKDDYAKWMLDDPRVNFAISTGCRPGHAAGFSHLGIQAEDEGELAEVYDRLARAERPIVEQQGHDLLLREIRQAMDRRPAGRALGNFPHLWRGHRLRRPRFADEAQGRERASACCEPAARAQPVPEPVQAEACCAPTCCPA